MGKWGNSLEGPFFPTYELHRLRWDRFLASSFQVALRGSVFPPRALSLPLVRYVNALTFSVVLGTLRSPTCLGRAFRRFFDGTGHTRRRVFHVRGCRNLRLPSVLKISLIKIKVHILKLFTFEDRGVRDPRFPGGSFVTGLVTSYLTFLAGG